MNDLLELHRSFLHRHKILDSLVLDGTGMKKSEIVEKMKEDGYLVVIGVTPCYRNHAIRKKSWHCVECRPDGLIYEGRFTKKSNIYIAQSKSSKFIKIGIGDNSLDRVKQLNYYKYGGISDWILSNSMQCEAAGRVEYDSHKALSTNKVTDKYYVKNDTEINSQEVFNCTLLQAKLAVERASGMLFRTDNLNKALQVSVAKKTNSSYLEYDKKSVAQFAAELGLPTALLLDQLKSAGVVKSALEDKLEESDKTALLDYLRKEHGAEQAPKNKITLTRKSNTEIKKTDSTGRARTIQVEVRKNIIQDRLNALIVNKSLSDADALREKYFKMDVNQLLKLWNSGKNDFENDERNIIRIATKNSLNVTA